MPEFNPVVRRQAAGTRRSGRCVQTLICLGKQFRFFISGGGWKVLPMAAVIAGLIAMLIRKDFFVNMEGSLAGAFALASAAIWNGCFNSIQSVCRERAVIKQEHRSGLHISSYMTAAIIYQFLLCAAQSALTMYILCRLQVLIPEGYGTGIVTPWMICDIGISMFLISCAADMMGLFLSGLSRTTTGAVILMPFVLVIQLVFSSSVIPLPEWCRPVSRFMISNSGIRAIAAESGYNELPMVTVWNILSDMRDSEIGGTVTVGQLLDALDNPALEKLRDMEVLKSYTTGEITEILSSADEYLQLREKEVIHPFTLRSIAEMILEQEALKDIREFKLLNLVSVGDMLTFLTEEPMAADLLNMEIGETMTLDQVLDVLHAEELADAASDIQVNPPFTFGDVVDMLKNNEALAEQRDRTITLKTTVGNVVELVGEETAKEFVQTQTARAAYLSDYEKSAENVYDNWRMLCIFILIFAALATVTLELINRDKR